jgi:abortive infection bacteriophage resistance protein
MAIYTQKALTIEAQTQLLVAKKLIISEPDYVKHCLSHLGYHRLKHYTYQFKDESRNFIPNTTFDQIIELYNFDRKLKFILFEALEAIEVAIKALISNQMSLAFGTHWYMEAIHFASDFNHTVFLESLKIDFDKAEEGSAKAYKKFYHTPAFPPSWMAMELITFGTISKIFKYLEAREVKKAICGHLRMPENILISWFHVFSLIRNRCTHHQRIVYRALPIELMLPQRQKHRFLTEATEVRTGSLYCGLSCIAYLLNITNPGCTFKTDIFALLKKYKYVNMKELGFTPNWQVEGVWL